MLGGAQALQCFCNLPSHENAVWLQLVLSIQSMYIIYTMQRVKCAFHATKPDVPAIVREIIMV